MKVMRYKGLKSLWRPPCAHAPARNVGGDRLERIEPARLEQPIPGLVSQFLQAQACVEAELAQASPILRGDEDIDRDDRRACLVRGCLRWHARALKGQAGIIVDRGNDIRE